MYKLKWHVHPKETGRFAWVHPRKWPYATYEGKDLPTEAAGSIECGEVYHPGNARSGAHPPLTVKFYSYEKGDGENRQALKFKKTFETLPEAKLALEQYVERHPEIKPKNKS